MARGMTLAVTGAYLALTLALASRIDDDEWCVYRDYDGFSEMSADETRDLAERSQRVGNAF